MRRAASSTKAFSSRRRRLWSMVTATVAVGASLSAAGPAAAQDAGVFTGNQRSADLAGQALPPPTCARFGPTPTDPRTGVVLQEDLTMVGTINGVATFKSSASFDASPLGTFPPTGNPNPSPTDCILAVPGYAVPGTLTVPGRCTNAPATYSRIGVVIRIKSPTCGAGGIAYTGVEVACPLIGCPPDPNNSDAVSAGTYETLTAGLPV